MNERIKELLVEARDQTKEGKWNAPTAVWAEKFAELIIQECTQLLFNESERLYSYSSECDNMRDSDEAELCAEKCMDNIKMIEQHFGFEE